MAFDEQCCRRLRTTRNTPVSITHIPFLSDIHKSSRRYLQNGNILAARTFITHFVSALPRSFYVETAAPISVGPTTEVTITTDSAVNFAQIAVVTCQRAQGASNKVMRESWVRLCGTYQSRGGLLAQPEVRRVRVDPFFFLLFGAEVILYEGPE